MRLLNLGLDNFQSFQNLEIDFSKLKVTSILGQYKDDIKRSNGSGKSTVFDGIIYGLYGKSRTKNADDLVQENKEEMECRLEFELGKDTIKIIRGKNPKKRYLNYFINGKDETDKKGETQNKINSKIGMDFDLFTATVFFQQAKEDKFTSSTPLERKNYLKNLLQLDVYDKANVVVKKRMKDFDKEISEVSGKLDYLRNSLEEYDIKIMEENLIKSKDALLLVQKSIKEIEKEIKSQQVFINQISILDSKKIKSTQLQDKYKEDIKVLENNLISLESKNKFEFSGVTKEELRKLEFDKENKMDSILEIENKLTRINILMENDKKRKENLQNEDICPTCDSNIDFNYKEKLFNKIDTNISKNIIEKDKLEIEIKNNKADREKIKNEYSTKRKLFESDRDKKLEQEKLIYMIRNSSKQLATIKEEFKQEKKEYEIIEIELNEVKQKIKKDIISEDDFQEIKDSEKTQIKIISNLEKDINNYKSSKKEYKLIKKQKEELNWKYNCYNIMKGIFGKNGITASIIKESIDEIEQEANDVLSEINSNEYEIIFETLKEKKDGDFSDTFDIWIKNDRAVRVYETYSGGQKALINFAIRMALSKILLKLNKVAFGFIALDEITGELDEYNKEKIIDIINYLKGTFNQIFVISHDFIKDCFKNSILIEYNKRSGLSKLKEVI